MNAMIRHHAASTRATVTCRLFFLAASRHMAVTVSHHPAIVMPSSCSVQYPDGSHLPAHSASKPPATPLNLLYQYWPIFRIYAGK